MRIFLFRGLLGDAFSTGMDRLADKLEALGHTVSVHRWMNRKRVQRRFLEEEHSNQVVAVIGHSLGGNAALAMANRFAEKQVNVRYLATLDPTVTGTVDGQIGAADNFRSRDIRDKPIAGAVEHNRQDLNHIQIDKDELVHERIISHCTPAIETSVTEVDETMAAIEKDGQLEDLADLDAVQTALNALMGSGALKSTQTNSELAAVVRLLVSELGTQTSVSDAATAPPSADPELTPVNAALGRSIGKLLNGRKTGIGILGLLGTAVLPTLFPQAAPVISLLQALGVGPEMVGEAAKDAETVKQAPNLLTPIFAALTGWGVLGKIDKWVAGYKIVKR